MDNKVYKTGEEVCKNLFWKTGNLRYYNMANAFKSLVKQNKC